MDREDVYERARGRQIVKGWVAGRVRRRSRVRERTHKGERAEAREQKTAVEDGDGGCETGRGIQK